MKKPIQAGDLCLVLRGYSGFSSPNVGLIVKVISRVYDCPEVGPLWRCEAQYGTRDRDDRSIVPEGYMDFAQSWLKRIDPPEALELQSIAQKESA